MSVRRIYIVLLLVLATGFGCGQPKMKIPKDIVQFKEMVDIMTDVHLAEAAKDIISLGSNSRKPVDEYYSMIFNKYHITKAAYEKSLDYYRSKPELMEQVYAEVTTRLSELQAKPGNH